MNNYKGEFFDKSLMEDIKSKFYHVDRDPVSDKERIFFDNAGGSFRLKTAVDNFKRVDSLPDCPEHSNKTALYLGDIVAKGIDDLRLIFNAKSGSLLTTLTASMAMFEMMDVVVENIDGSNIVTSALEHPSAYDAAEYFSKKHNKELRVVEADTNTGGIDVNELMKLIDKDTCVLSIMAASNISGSIIDIEKIVEEARKKKPDIYILIDAVQHMPHSAVDVEKLKIDGMNFASYKFFGTRGYGVAYMSDRLAKLPHRKLIAKEDNIWALGTPSPGQIASVSAIVEYVIWLGGKFSDSKNQRDLYEIGMSKIHKHETALLNLALEGNEEIKGLRYIENVTMPIDCKDLSMRDIIFCIGFKNIDLEEAVDLYEENNIIVYPRLLTNVYSKRILESLNSESVIRVSPLHCNSKEDILEFLKITEKIAEFRKE